MIIFLNPTHKQSTLLIDNEERYVNFNLNLDLKGLPMDVIVGVIIDTIQQLNNQVLNDGKYIIVIPFMKDASALNEEMEKIGVRLLMYKRTIVFNADGKMNSPEIYKMYLPG